MKTTDQNQVPCTLKTTVFNLIILDESGSMCSLAEQTISGCNETINVVRSAEKANGQNRRNLVSIYAFQSHTTIPSRYLVKNQPVLNVRNITSDDYSPEGATPLLDAVGSTLAELLAIASTHEDADAIITIITDGHENSSKQYTYEKVAALISQAKELGWTINFIGANINEMAIGARMNVHPDNIAKWDANPIGAKAMFDKIKCKLRRVAKEDAEKEVGMSREERIAYRKARSKEFFTK